MTEAASAGSRVQSAKAPVKHCSCPGCTHPAGEVPLHETLHKELGLEGGDEGGEGVDGESLHQRLVLVDHGPAAVLQDQQPHVPAGPRDTSTAISSCWLPGKPFLTAHMADCALPQQPLLAPGHCLTCWGSLSYEQRVL